MIKVFFSYNFKDRDDINIFFNFFERKVIYETKVYDIYFFDEVVHTAPFEEEIDKAISECDYFLLFLGRTVGNTQYEEFNKFIEYRGKSKKKKLVCVHLSGYSENNKSTKQSYILKIASQTSCGTVFLGPDNNHFVAFSNLVKKYLILPDRMDVKEDIRIGLNDDLPVFNLFSYEKDIINHYIDKAKVDKMSDADILADKEFQDKYESINNKTKRGCPPDWPRVEEMQPEKIRKINELLPSTVGNYRPKNREVFSAALTSYHERCGKDGFTFTFPEAGPREELFYPVYFQSKDDKEAFKVAVLVSGGIAPGINAVIDGITQRHFMYHNAHLSRKPDDLNLKNLEIWGLMNGFQAFNRFASNYVFLINNESNIPQSPHGQPSTPHGYIDTSKHVNEAGSILGTSRFEDLLEEPQRDAIFENILQSLERNQIRILYIIGGDGSMRAAHALYHLAKNYKKKSNSKWSLSVVGIPKTMDNDILWAWQTFGFSSAVEKSRAIIEDLAVEVKSNPRLGIIQLFGSDSGFVVSHSVLASGTGICDLALIPEVDFSLNKILDIIKKKYSLKGHGLIVLAETAIPTDAMQFVKNRPEIINIDYYENTIPVNVRKFLNNFYEKATIYEFSSLNDIKDISLVRKKMLKYQLQNRCYLEYLTEELFKILENLKDQNLNKILKKLKPKAKQVYLLRMDLSDNGEKKLREYIGSLEHTDDFHQIDLYCLRESLYLRILNRLAGKQQGKFEAEYKLRKNEKGMDGNRYYFNGSLAEFSQLKTLLRAQGVYHYSDIDLSSAEQAAVIKYFKAFLKNRRIEGQTNDNLRNAGLKMIEQGIKNIDPKWGSNMRTLTSEPRHLLRSMPPGTIDIINGSRLGTLAVDNAMAGYSDFMISQWLTEFCMVPLKLVVLGRKRIPPTGIFWKSVIAKTGQPQDLVD